MQTWTRMIHLGELQYMAIDLGLLILTRDYELNILTKYHKTYWIHLTVLSKVPVWMLHKIIHKDPLTYFEKQTKERPSLETV